VQISGEQDQTQQIAIQVSLNVKYIHFVVFNGANPPANNGPHLPMMTYFLPNSVVDLIASKFDALSPEQRLLLKVASVIGTFELRILEGVFPPVQKQRMNLKQQLDTLEKLGFIQRGAWASCPSARATYSQPVYSFTHLLAQVFDTQDFSQLF
jgi:hypothetical protein